MGRPVRQYAPEEISVSVRIPVIQYAVLRIESERTNRSLASILKEGIWKMATEISNRKQGRG